MLLTAVLARSLATQTPAVPSPIVLEALPVRRVAWSLSPDRRTAATLGGDGEVVLWSIGADARAHVVRRFGTPAWPDSGTLPDLLAVSDGGAYVALRRPQGGFDLWRAAEGKVARRVEFPVPEYQWQTAWLPRGGGALFETGRRPQGETDSTRLVRLDGRTLELPVGAPWSFTPDGKAVLGTTEKGLALVDLATGHVRSRFEDATQSSPPYAFSPDGALLATAGEDPVWRGPDIGPNDPAPTEAAYAHTLKIKVWNVATGRRLRMLDGYFSPNGEARLVFLDRRRLAAPGLGWTLDVPTGRIVGKYEPVEPAFGLTLPPLPTAPLRERTVLFPERPALGRNLAASPDGRLLIVSESRGPIGARPRLLVWNASLRRLVGRIELAEILNLKTVDFAADGRLLVDGDRRPPPGRKGEFGFPPDNVPVRLEITLDRSGKATSRKATPLPARPSRFPFGPPPVPSHAGGFSIGTRPARGYMFVDLFRTDERTGQEAWTSSEIDFPHSRVVLSPDDRRFAVAWSKGPVRPDMRTTLGVFDASTGKPLVSVPLGPTVWSLVYSPDGSRLLLATPDGLEVRDAGTLEILARVAQPQESGDVQTVWLSGGGFAVVRQGQELRLYDAHARLQATLVAFPASGWAAWSPAGEVQGSPDGLVYLRRVEGDRLLPVDKALGHEGG